jgi:hypothetical protein
MRFSNAANDIQFWPFRVVFAAVAALAIRTTKPFALL